jgi:Zinc carboxypeptidase
MRLGNLVRWLVGLVALGAVTAPGQAQSFNEGAFDPAIPTLTATVGHAPATRITSPDQANAYLKALAAAAPDRARLVQYAVSWEGRPLHYLVLTAPENMARLDAIRADMASIAAGRPGNGTALPVTWLAYGVHGNEISSTDAALMTAYHLLAAQGDERAAKIMANTIVVLDPMQNPDGRARFVNNFLASTGIAPAADRQAAEHDEPWPSGRVNHYMFGFEPRLVHAQPARNARQGGSDPAVEPGGCGRSARNGRGRELFLLACRAALQPQSLRRTGARL